MRRLAPQPLLPSTDSSRSFYFFFFNDTATTEIYTLSLHDALPIYARTCSRNTSPWKACGAPSWRDRKSTRLNSSHLGISYAVFCLKKKKCYLFVLLQSFFRLLFFFGVSRCLYV